MSTTGLDSDKKREADRPSVTTAGDEKFIRQCATMAEATLELASLWGLEARQKMIEEEGHLPSDVQERVRHYLLEKASGMGSGLTAIIKSWYLADTETGIDDQHLADKICIGEPISGGNIEVSGDMTGGVLFLVDRENDIIQSAVRLHVSGEDKHMVVDVYSLPVAPIRDPERKSTICSTAPSRETRIMQFAERNDIEVHGRLKFPEIQSAKIPEYKI